MKGRNVFLSGLLFFLILPVGPALAKTAYLSDMLYVRLREAPGSGNTIKTLKTADQFTVLEKKGGYLRVRTVDGKMGWLPGQYVSNDPPKAVVISRLRAENLSLREKVEALRDKLQAKVNAAEALQKRNGIEEKLLTDTIGSHDLVGQLDRLQQANDKLLAQMDSLRRRAAVVRKVENVQWFLAGSGVLLGGWILGKLSQRKKEPKHPRKFLIHNI